MNRTITFQCPDCGKTWIESMDLPDCCGVVVEGSVFGRCDVCHAKFEHGEEIRKAVVVAINDAKVPREYIDWDASLGNGPLMAAVMDCRRGSMVVHGVNRSGKTRSCCHALIQCIKEHTCMAPFFVDWQSFIDEYTLCESKSEKLRTLMRLKTADPLILDDIAVKKVSQAEGAMLFTLLNAAVESGRRVWITINGEWGEVVSRFENRDQAAKIGARIKSLIEAGGRSIKA